MAEKLRKRAGKNLSGRIATQQRRIQRGQQRARRYLESGRSMVDELLAERREAAKSE